MKSLTIIIAIFNKNLTLHQGDSSRTAVRRVSGLPRCVCCAKFFYYF